MTEYKVGDSVWLYNGGNPNPLVKGKVVHKFQLNDSPMYYIVELPTEIEPLLVVRDWATLSSDGKTLNIYKGPHVWPIN